MKGLDCSCINCSIFDIPGGTCYFDFMMKVKPADIAIFLFALALSFSSFLLFQTFSGAKAIHVTTETGTWVYDLSVDAMIDFEGPIGITTMEIEGGRVHVHASDCKNQVCVLAGWIDSPGEWIACLPNNVFIVIQGTPEIAGEGGIDDSSY